MGSILSKRMRAADENVPLVETGLFSGGKRNHEWRLSAFANILNSEELIDSSGFRWRMRNILGTDLEWQIRLMRCTHENKPWLGMSWTLQKIKSSSIFTLPRWVPNSILHQMRLTVQDLRGQEFIVNSGKIERLREGESRYMFLVERDVAEDNLPLDNGVLTADITFEIFTTEAKYSTRLIEEPAKAQPELIKLSSPLEANLTNADVLLVATDGVRMPAHSVVLVAASPTLGDRATEVLATAGPVPKILELERISGKTLRVFHHFLYSGEVFPEWSDIDVVAELTDAAGAFEVNELINFLDDAIGKEIKREVALTLLLLTSRYEMGTARKDILDWMKVQPLGVVFG